MTEEELEDYEIEETGIDWLVRSGPHYDPYTGPASGLAGELKISAEDAAGLIKKWEQESRIALKTYDAHNMGNGESVVNNRGLTWERID
jgi:hypothetical protein